MIILLTSIFNGRWRVERVNLTSRTNFSTLLQQEVIPDRCANPVRKLKDGTVEPRPPFWLYCSSCGRRKKIEPSCGKRNCKRCQSKRAMKLERKYLEAILKKNSRPGHMWTFVNLTGIHIEPHLHDIGNNLRKFGNAMQQFLREEYNEAGLAVIEHTTRYAVKALLVIEDEGDFFGYSVQGPATIIGYQEILYVHGHALCYGGYKDKISFERRWAAKLLEAGFLTSETIQRNDGRRFVGLELVRNPKHAVGYILKYVAKGVELPDEYLEALKRLKYVRSWGFLYGMKEPTFDMVCLDCGGKCYVAFDENMIIDYYGDKSEPLRIQRIPREVVGPP